MTDRLDFLPENPPEARAGSFPAVAGFLHLIPASFAQSLRDSRREGLEEILKNGA